MDSARPIFELVALSKSFGQRIALRQVSFCMGAGERVLLLGANGSGKSTMLRLGSGLLSGDQGKVRLFGEDLAHKNQRSIGYVGHALMMYGDLSVEENLKLYAGLYQRKTDLQSYLNEWALSQYGQTPLRHLSKGTAARVALARAHIGEPKIMLLDEPTSALDDRAVQALLETIDRTMNCNTTQSCALIATHDVSRLASFANRVIVLEQGEIVRDSGAQAPRSTMEEVISLYRQENR